VALRRLLPTGLSVARWGDLFTPAFALEIAIGRLACVFTGCCFGSVSSLPWAMQFSKPSLAWYLHMDGRLIPPDALVSLPVHPLPVYFMLIELALVAFTLWFLRRKSYDGQVVLIFLAVHGLIKFPLEYLRYPYEWLHQPVPLVLGLAASAVLVAQWLRRRGSNAYAHA
jgi:phosphatidylglycerol:prolipoprotein diacylglycerol transferase